MCTKEKGGTIQDGAGLGLHAPQQLGCREVGLLRARVARAREDGAETQQDLLLLEGCKLSRRRIAEGPRGSSSEEEEVPGVPSTQAQPCQEPEPAAGLEGETSPARDAAKPRAVPASPEPGSPSRSLLEITGGGLEGVVGTRVAPTLPQPCELLGSKGVVTAPSRLQAARALGVQDQA